MRCVWASRMPASLILFFLVTIGLRRKRFNAMPSERYPILPVPLPPEALEYNESRGSRTKFWVRVSGESNSWLLKFPRPNTGEHWAEKVAAEIGNLVGINCARVELARCEGQFAMFGQAATQQEGHWQTYQNQLVTVCESFLPSEQSADDSADIDIHTFHGYEILEMFIEGYDTNQRFGQREHSVKNIVSSMMALMGARSLNPIPLWDFELEMLASYALLDGLIGNTDRHHENWMVAHIYEGDNVRWKVAPSFDHASSLGRELTDQGRRRILEADAMLNYLHRGRGGVFVDRNRRRALSPLRLAQLLCRWMPDFTRETRARIAEVSDSQIRDTVNKVPSEFMSDIAKEFAYKAIVTGQDELLRSVR